MVCLELVLHDRGGRGSLAVRRGGRDDDQVDVRVAQAGVFDGTGPGPGGQVAGRFTGRGDPPFPDPKILLDPGCRGRERFFQHLIRADGGGKIRARSDDLSVSDKLFHGVSIL